MRRVGCGGGERSRSPRNTEWISRSVVALARYPGKRPAGLKVDSDGGFLLSNLMSVWGDSQNVSRKDVLDALVQNAETSSGTKRFELVTTSDGDTHIRASARRGAGGVGASWSGSGAGKWAADGGGGGGNGWGGSSGSRDRAGTDRSRNWKSEDHNHGGNWWKDTSWNGDDGESWKESADDKRSSVTLRPRWENAKSDPDSWKGKWQSKDEQWNDYNSQGGRWRPKEQASTSSTWHQGKNGDVDAEKVLPYLDWLLQPGQHTVDIGMTGGWAALTAVAKAMVMHKPGLGITSVKQLTELVQGSDADGSFEIAGGQIRKVRREQRRTNGSGSYVGGGASAPTTPTHTGSRSHGSAWGSAMLAPARQRTPPAGGVWTEEQAATKFETNSRNTEGLESTKVQPRKPPPPPGPGWTQFTDEGTLWWFYEGDLGKWWKSDSDADILPFVE